MEQHHFDIILEQLVMIEENTRKEEKEKEKKEKGEEFPSPSVFLDEAIKQIQEQFFTKLQSKTGWGRNDIKQVFTESVRSVRTPIVEEDLP